MIRLIDGGEYNLSETKNQTKILTLTNRTFAWIYAKGIGEILVRTYRKHKVNHFLALGHYRIYQVKDEKSLTDLEHLELEVGHSVWQGYLLPTGLPTSRNRRNRIITSNEIITKVTTTNNLPALIQVA